MSTVVGTAVDVGVEVVKIPFKGGQGVYDAVKDDDDEPKKNWAHALSRCPLTCLRMRVLGREAQRERKSDKWIRRMAEGERRWSGPCALNWCVTTKA